MPELISISYGVNVAVLLPVCLGLLMPDNGRFSKVFGPRTTAREILVCFYLALLLISAYLLFVENRSAILAWPILGLQVVYKSLSLAIIRDKKAPVYGFNFVIAFFHAVTLSMNPVGSALN